MDPAVSGLIGAIIGALAATGGQAFVRRSQLKEARRSATIAEVSALIDALQTLAEAPSAASRGRTYVALVRSYAQSPAVLKPALDEAWRSFAKAVYGEATAATVEELQRRRDQEHSAPNDDPQLDQFIWEDVPDEPSDRRDDDKSLTAGAGHGTFVAGVVRTLSDSPMPLPQQQSLYNAAGHLWESLMTWANPTVEFELHDQVGRMPSRGPRYSHIAGVTQRMKRRLFKGD